ncbi:MAG: hypothetical protein RR301_04910 [Clostridia bacterium]
MNNWEDRLRAWVAQYALVIGSAAVLLLGLAVRAFGLAVTIPETTPWLEILPGNAILAQKLTATLLDAALCAACVTLLRELLPKEQRALGGFVGFALCWLHPLPMMSAAVWGQADAGVAALCVLAVLAYLRGKPGWAMTALGLGIAWKPQAAFLLPLFAILYLCGPKRFCLLWLLLAPAFWALRGTVALLLGAESAFRCTLWQPGNPMTNGCPNLFAIVGTPAGVPDMAYEILACLGAAAALGLMGGMGLMLTLRGRTLQKRTVTLLGAWCVLCCTFFLPGMQARCGLAGEMLLLCWAISRANRRGWGYVLLGVLPTLSAYMGALFERPFLPLEQGGYLALLLLVSLTWELWRETAAPARQTAAEGRVLQ